MSAHGLQDDDCGDGDELAERVDTSEIETGLLMRLWRFNAGTQHRCSRIVSAFVSEMLMTTIMGHHSSGYAAARDAILAVGMSEEELFDVWGDRVVQAVREEAERGE